MQIKKINKNNLLIKFLWTIEAVLRSRPAWQEHRFSLQLGGAKFKQ